MKIGIAGDWHQNHLWAAKTMTYFADRGVYNVFQVGDFGLFNDLGTHHLLDSVNYVCRDHGMTLYVLRGNHDSNYFEHVLSSPFYAKSNTTGGALVRSNIVFLPRTGRFEFGGRTFQIAAGAVSIDKGRRQLGKSWWVEEELTDAEVDRVPEKHCDILLTHDCFTGGTEYITAEGWKTLSDTVGTTQKVLTSSGFFKPAEIKSFGRKRIWKVTATLRGQHKEWFTTKRHRWIVTSNPNHASRDNPRRIDKNTFELIPGDKLEVRYPSGVLNSRTTMSPFAVAAGIVYGDGTLDKGNAVVNLYGGKKELLRYFPLSRTTPAKVGDGVRVLDLPASFKTNVPDVTDGMPEKLGWLAGYFATDGNASIGYLTISSSMRENLERFRALALSCGIATREIKSRVGSGYTGDNREYYEVALVPQTVPGGFLINQKHADDFANGNSGAPKREYWTVTDVDDLGYEEEVFCPVVDAEEHNFALDNFVITGNCSNSTPFARNLSDHLDSKIHRQRIDRVLRKTTPHLHFHGHMHQFYHWTNYVGGYYPVDTYGLDMDHGHKSNAIVDLENLDVEVIATL